MSELEIKRMDTKVLLALCNILDSYEDFSEKVKELYKSFKNVQNISNLWKIAKGDMVLGSTGIKKFYNENKEIVDTIRKYSYISDFMLYYNLSGESKLLDFFYQYFVEHKDDLDQIKMVLEKLIALNFNELNFAEGLDFTFDECKISTKFDDNFEIEYLDNIEVIPTYRDDIVQYKTTGSNYKMTVRKQPPFEDFYKSARRIYVNSLTFDPDRLPSDITKTEIFDTIVCLKQSKESEELKKLIDLDISVDQFDLQFNIMRDVIQTIDNVEDKDELVDAVVRIKEDLSRIKSATTRYNEKVLRENEKISKEQLEKEKKIVLEKKYKYKSNLV